MTPVLSSLRNCSTCPCDDAQLLEEIQEVPTHLIVGFSNVYEVDVHCGHGIDHVLQLYQLRCPGEYELEVDHES